MATLAQHIFGQDYDKATLEYVINRDRLGPEHAQQALASIQDREMRDAVDSLLGQMCRGIEYPTFVQGDYHGLLFDRGLAHVGLPHMLADLLVAAHPGYKKLREQPQNGIVLERLD